MHAWTSSSAATPVGRRRPSRARPAAAPWAARSRTPSSRNTAGRAAQGVPRAGVDQGHRLCEPASGRPLRVLGGILATGWPSLRVVVARRHGLPHSASRPPIRSGDTKAMHLTFAHYRNRFCMFRTYYAIAKGIVQPDGLTMSIVEVPDPPSHAQEEALIADEV